ncbi:uncharacterized protein DDB_G0271670 isoform X1 [Drosophila willistoni]|uniref:uncharacterized protein DDB_G0271670 isoform X1 n=1 Tax=Drosophila willistoni TaxID=7260 RepID=UPI000C26D6BE|nr:uncharacterized protein DDB_G0271670 isoform X1 [Drosophila willistoni]
MTFYWWSHWFWITWLGVQLLPAAHTYPSSEIIKVGQGDDASSEIIKMGQTEDRLLHTTKLYQTTASQTWSTATQSNIMDLTLRPTTAASRSSMVTTSMGETLSDVDHKDEEEEEDEDGEDENNESEDQAVVELNDEQQLSQYEFKRSADFTLDQLNNYTNFSTNGSSNTSNSKTTTTLAATSSASEIVTTTTSATSSSSSPLSSSTSNSSLSTSTTTTTTTTAATSATTKISPLISGGSATPSTPKINTEWLSDELLGEKAPFTLENANKEDELRRAESEHRSRKSKVLSAEYKHINRYINFSSDTKSLLTRSASAAPSIAAASGYDGGGNDEGNISSEALAIQRTYFLDAGAISAICFTVFGICCTVGTIGIVLYRRRYLNKPQALSEPDSSVYIDDSTMRVSDNSDEMYSLDNDSFLNSLEAMTIQNYWTDTVKHTKL